MAVLLEFILNMVYTGSIRPGNHARTHIFLRRKPIMKKLTAIICLALCALLCLSGIACAESATPNIDKIKENGKIVMLTNAAFPPFEYLGDELNEDGTAKVVGVDADIAAEIAKDLGVELEIVDMDFDSIILAVQSGKGDFGAAGMTVKPEREEMVNFSIKYVKSSQYILVKADSDIKCAADLEGKTIGVQLGTTGDFFATDEIPGSVVMPYKDAVIASLDLANGRVDAVITDELPAKAIAASNEALVLIEEVLTEEEYAIAVAKEKTDLLEAINKTITRLQEEGKIEVFINTHMGLETPEESAAPEATAEPAK